MELTFPTTNGSSEPVLSECLLFKVIDAKVKPSAEQLRANRLFARLRFISVADWLVRNQAPGDDGAWAVPARHEFTKNISLAPGWCSAMGQGKDMLSHVIVWLPYQLLVHKMHFLRHPAWI